MPPLLPATGCTAPLTFSPGGILSNSQRALELRGPRRNGEKTRGSVMLGANRREGQGDLIGTLVPATSRWRPLALAAPALASCRRPPPLGRMAALPPRRLVPGCLAAGRRPPVAGRWSPGRLDTQAPDRAALQLCLMPASAPLPCSCSSACFYRKPVGGGLLGFGIGRFARGFGDLYLSFGT